MKHSQAILTAAGVATAAALLGANRNEQLKAAFARLNKFEEAVAEQVAQSLPAPKGVKEAVADFGMDEQAPSWRARMLGKTHAGQRAMGGYDDANADWLPESSCGCES